MRAAGIIALVLLLPACKSEPDFDTRYTAQSEQLNAAAANMQAELENQVNASRAAGLAPEMANASSSNDGAAQ